MKRPTQKPKPNQNKGAKENRRHEQTVPNASANNIEYNNIDNIYGAYNRSIDR
jgi:hypothetical protein